MKPIRANFFSVLFILFFILHPQTSRAEEKNWWPSKYGADDQIGALNLISPQKIVEASRLVREGKVYDLGRVVEEDMPKFPGRYWHQTLVSSAHILNTRKENYQTGECSSADSKSKPACAEGGWGENQINWITELVTGTYQVGTQLDGLNHLQIGDRAYNGNQLKDIVEEWGTNKLGVETIPPIVTRGVLIDLTESRKGEMMKPGEVITVAMVEDFLKKHGLEVGDGDVLLFHTGWGSLWKKSEDFSKGEPGPGVELAQWIVKKGIAATGCDTWSFGAVPGENPARPFEVPQMLNVKNGVFILENLKTEELAENKVYEFQFVVTHAKTKGSTAAQVSPAAIV